jgi:hypothetical protein
MRLLPDIGAGVVMMCNAEGVRDFSPLLDEILRIIVP